ncbi:MAG: hypothetical protein ACI9G1_001231 [Pirellulaceae bacterium]|jgi:hypothetical protein
MQFNGYSFDIPGYAAWEVAFRRGDCSPIQAQWFEPKSSVELYRVNDDPDNVRNLASAKRYAAILSELQAARALAGIGDQKNSIPVVRRFLENPGADILELLAVLAVDECDLLKADPKLRQSLQDVKGTYAKRVVDKLFDRR